MISFFILPFWPLFSPSYFSTPKAIGVGVPDRELKILLEENGRKKPGNGEDQALCGYYVAIFPLFLHLSSFPFFSFQFSVFRFQVPFFIFHFHFILLLHSCFHFFNEKF